MIGGLALKTRNTSRKTAQGVVKSITKMGMVVIAYGTLPYVNMAGTGR